MNTIARLVQDLAGRDHPSLTWYGPDAERVDLSGRTAANWIIKATNLLTTELAPDPGYGLLLDLPVHWRSVIWAFAGWSTGARIVSSPAEADVVVTARPRPELGDAEMIVIALPALARSVEDLPPGAIDGAGDLMTQPDALMFPPQGSATDATGLGLTQSELLGADVALEPLPHAPASPGQPRVLIRAADLPSLLGAVPALWSLPASILISEDPSVAEAEGATHARAGDE